MAGIAHRGRANRPRPRVLTLLAIVVLVPTVGMGSLTLSSAAAKWASRKASSNHLSDTVDLAALIDARVAVTTEGIQSESLAKARSDGLAPTTLSKILGIDLVAVLHEARAEVDRNPAFKKYPVLAGDLAQLHVLRRGVDTGNVSFAKLDQVTSAIGVDLDTTWQKVTAELRDDVNRPNGGGSLISQRLSTVELTFSLYTTALQEIRFASDLATNASGTDDLRQLVEMEGRFSGDAANMGTGTGPLTANAWASAQRDPATQRFEGVIQQSMSSGFAGVHAPYTTNVTAFAEAFKDSLTWSADLAAVLRAAAIDLRSVAVHDRDRAFRDFATELTIAFLIVLITMLATVLLGRALVRPLQKLASSAHAVSLGRFKLPPLPVHGPREVAATSTAVNELTGTLTALEAYTEALAEDPFSPVLEDALPGPVGQALQTALDRLRESTRAIEQQRLALQELATHDHLTGLLNRGAALEAIGRDLARMGRDQQLTMAVLFIDLDGLKVINDRFGHETGDEAIVLLANALRDTTRQGDVVGRLGGDEFLVASLGPYTVEDLHGLADRILQRVGEQVLAVGTDSQVAVRCSIGGARAEPGDSAEALISRADFALYRAKQRGGDRIAWSDDPAVSRP